MIYRVGLDVTLIDDIGVEVLNLKLY